MSDCTSLSSSKNDVLLKWYEGDYYGKSLIQKTVKNELRKIGGLSQMEEDNFYSIANEVFFNSLKLWDEKRSFRTFFVSNLRRKISTELRDMNRKKNGGNGGNVFISNYDNNSDPTGEKRYKERERAICTSRKANTLSLDYVIDDETDMYDYVYGGDNIKDFLDELCSDNSDAYNDFLSYCSRLQREILSFKMDNLGCQEKEICNALNISPTTYHQQMEDLLDNPYVFMLEASV